MILILPFVACVNKLWIRQSPSAGPGKYLHNYYKKTTCSLEKIYNILKIQISKKIKEFDHSLSKNVERAYDAEHTTRRDRKVGSQVGFSYETENNDGQ